jgi:multidrug efflux pump subunit AcrB
MVERQKALADIILKDPAVESLSSFIGIDGVNITFNSGRLLTNLKPLEQRDAGAIDVINRIQEHTSKITGISLFMQPVQDLTIDDRVSRTHTTTMRVMYWVQSNTTHCWLYAQPTHSSGFTINSVLMIRI